MKVTTSKGEATHIVIPTTDETHWAIVDLESTTSILEDVLSVYYITEDNISLDAPDFVVTDMFSDSEVCKNFDFAPTSEDPFYIVTTEEELDELVKEKKCIFCYGMELYFEHGIFYINGHEIEQTVYKTKWIDVFLAMIDEEH